MEGWLARLEPGLLDRWHAYEQLHGDEELEYQLVRLIEIVKLGFVAVCHAWGKPLEPQDLDPRQESRQVVMGPAAAAAIVGAGCGVRGA